MSSYRASDPHLAYGDDYDQPRPQRWDRDTFERYRQQYSRPEPERERIHIDERETRRGGAPVRELDIEIDDRHRGPRRRGSDIDIRIREDVRPARRVDFLNEPDPAEIAAKALAPYRRRVSIQPEPEVRRPARPMYIRRQSSLDTFDRRPAPRYHDEYRIPADVNIPLPIRRRERERERDYEQIKPRERERSSGTEYSEDIHIRRRKSRGGRRENKEGKKAPTVRESSSSSHGSFEEIKKTEIIEDDLKSVKSARTSKSRKTESVVSEEKFEEVQEEEVQERGKKGKTRMPKRLAHKGAIIELGYAFEEEEDFYIVRRALGKEHIDEIIEVSKSYKVQEMKRVHRYEISPERSELNSVHESEHDDEYIKTTTIIHEHDDKSTVRAPSPTGTHRTYRTATRAPTVREETIAQEELQESASIAGPLASLVRRTDNRPRSRRDIEKEIEDLEIERRSLRRERDDDDKKSRHHRRGKSRHDERRETDYEFVERVERRSRSLSSDRETRRDVREVIRVEKDRKERARSRARSKSRGPNPKLVALAMATLT